MHESRKMRAHHARIQHDTHTRAQARPKHATNLGIPIRDAYAYYARRSHEPHHAINVSAPTGGAHASCAGIRHKCIHPAWANQGHACTHLLDATSAEGLRPACASGPNTRTLCTPKKEVCTCIFSQA